jgi:hypothetical protein
VVNFGTNFSTLFFLIPRADSLRYCDAVRDFRYLWFAGGRACCPAGGNVWIRRLFLILVATLLIKLLWETLH